MDWFTGIIVYLLIWWTALFVVLPIGTRPVEEADPAAGGWRGTPQRPLILRKVIGTTVLATVLWLGAYALIESNLVSFREGWFAYQGPSGSVPRSGGAQN
jgi:predicted secreted protein